MKNTEDRSLGAPIFVLILGLIVVFFICKGYMGDISTTYTKIELIAICLIILGQIMNIVSIVKARNN